MNTTSLPRLISVCACLFLFLSNLAGAATSTDDFNDNSKNTSRWGTDTKFNRGVLTERNGRLEYTVSSGTLEDDAWRPYVLHRFPYNANWEIQFDVFNSTKPNFSGLVNSIGILIQPARLDTNSLFTELYSSALGGLPSRTGFDAELETGDTTYGIADREGGAGVTNAAVRVVFDSTAKLFNLYYDIDVSDGYQWVPHGVFGIAGSGGIDGDTDWALTSSDQFVVFIYGYSVGMTITSGEMYVDNFVETGGVLPAGGPLPDPLGNFQFRFPTNNPLLTRIVNVTGNYSGVSQTSSHRNYNFDLAEDETGKLSVMGTIDGIADANGNTQLAASAGTIRTVSGQPSAQLKGSFKGARDGVKTSFSGRATVPVQIVDVGGGTNGVTGSGSYSSRIGTLPFSGKNLPVNVAAPPNSEQNLRQDWSLHLDIKKKLIGTKERTVASARLELPNGDTVDYPERIAKYSATKGYSLSFTRGTNITVNPPKIGSRSRIYIRGMTLIQQGTDEWRPNAGSIDYQFLGQKGKANLMDFAE